MPVRLEMHWRATANPGGDHVRAVVWTDIVLSGVEARVTLRARAAERGGSRQLRSWRRTLVALGARLSRREICVFPQCGARVPAVRVTDAEDRVHTPFELAQPRSDGEWHVQFAFMLPVELSSRFTVDRDDSVARCSQVGISGELTIANGLALSVGARERDMWPASRAAGPLTPAEDIRRLTIVARGMTKVHHQAQPLAEMLPWGASVFATFLDEWGHELEEAGAPVRCSLS